MIKFFKRIKARIKNWMAIRRIKRDLTRKWRQFSLKYTEASKGKAKLSDDDLMQWTDVTASLISLHVGQLKPCPPYVLNVGVSRAISALNGARGLSKIQVLSWLLQPPYVNGDVYDLMFNKKLTPEQSYVLKAEAKYILGVGKWDNGKKLTTRDKTRLERVLKDIYPEGYKVLTFNKEGE